MPIFHTWKFGDVRFLAVERDGTWHVVNERGDWFGAWSSVEEFRKRLNAEGDENYYLSRSSAFLNVSIRE